MQVVEAFFLNPQSGRYLELEFGPHGQHLVLLMQAPGKSRIRDKLPLDCKFSMGRNYLSIFKKNICFEVNYQMR